MEFLSAIAKENLKFQIGTFDPYSDDPRLAVKKVWLCSTSGTLIVAGTAGHAIIVTLGDEPLDSQIPVSSLDKFELCCEIYNIKNIENIISGEDNEHCFRS